MRSSCAGAEPAQCKGAHKIAREKLLDARLADLLLEALALQRENGLIRGVAAEAQGE